MIQSIEITRIRGIREGRLDEFAPLSVLVGPNGSGKSTVLEAAYIAGSTRTADAISTVVLRRVGMTRPAAWLLLQSGREGRGALAIQTTGGFTRTLSIRGESIEGATNDHVVFEVTQHSFPGSSKAPEQSAGVVEFKNDARQAYSGVDNPPRGVEDVDLIDAGKIGQRELTEQYSRTVQQGRRQHAIEILRQVIPNLQNMEILTDGGVPNLNLVYGTHAVPVAVAGDGVYALTQTCLRLASRPQGVVLFEEPELHLHPRGIRQTAAAIQAAVRRGVQVILTTHALELIDALVAEAQSDDEVAKMAVYRLALDNGILKSSRIPGEEVAFARATVEDDLR